MLLFVIALTGHFALEVIVVLSHAHALLHELIVAHFGLVGALLKLGLPVGDLLLESVDAVGRSLDVLAVLLISLQLLLVLTDLGVCLGLVSVELNFKSAVKLIDLFNQLVLHALELFNVLVFSLFPGRLEVGLHQLELLLLLLFDRLNQLT
jgi:hypothetical protein